MRRRFQFLSTRYLNESSSMIRELWIFRLTQLLMSVHTTSRSKSKWFTEQARFSLPNYSWYQISEHLQLCKIRDFRVWIISEVKKSPETSKSLNEFSLDYAYSSTTANNTLQAKAAALTWRVKARMARPWGSCRRSTHTRGRQGRPSCLIAGSCPLLSLLT